MHHVILHVISAGMAQNMSKHQTFSKTVSFLTNNEVLIFKKKHFLSSKTFYQQYMQQKESSNNFYLQYPQEKH